MPLNPEANLRLHIDFASDIRISGWIADTSTMSLPVGLRIRVASGAFFEVSPRNIKLREDVCRELNLPGALETGFDINLLDLTNDRCSKYYLMLGDYELWNYDEFLLGPDNVANVQLNTDLIKEFGQHQIILIYEENAWLHHQLAQIHQWREKYFHKGYQSGVSYCFSGIKEFVKNKEKLLKPNEHGILLIDRGIYKSAFHHVSEPHRSWPLIILDNELILKRDFIGLLSGLCALLDIPDRTLIKPSHLLRLLTALSSHKGIFFDENADLFCMHSGTPKPWMHTFMQHQIQGVSQDDVIVLSERPLRRISEIEPDSCAIFVRTGAIRFVLDLTAAGPRELLTGAFLRGLRVKALTQRQL